MDMLPTPFDDILDLPLPDINIIQQSVVTLSPIVYPPSPIPSLASLCMKSLSNLSILPKNCKYLPLSLKQDLLESLKKTKKIVPDDDTLSLLWDGFQKNLDFSDYSYVLPRTLISAIVNSCFHLTSLTLDRIQIDNCILDEYYPSNISFPHLKFLSMNRTSLESSFIIPILSGAPKLLSFSAEHCKYLDFSNVFKQLSQSCSSLKELKIGDNCSIPSNDLSIFLSNVSLKSLCCKNSRWLDKDVIYNIIPNCSDLIKLNLSENYFLTDDIINTIISHCDRLVSLSLTNCWNLSDNVISSICKYCIDIKELYVDGCSLLTDECISIIIDSSSISLKLLSIRDCELITSDGYERLLHHCPHLQSFDLSENNIPIDILSQNCQNLKEIRVSGNSTHVKSNFIAQLAKNCPLVNTVEIRNNSYLDSSCVLSIVRNWKNLRFLTLDKCLQLDDCAMIAISKYSHNLEELSIHKSHFSKKIISSFIKTCKTLKIVNFSECPKITDDNIFELASKCNLIQKVDFSGCKKITVEGIEKFLSVAPHLLSLTCDELSDKAANTLQNQCRNLYSLKVLKAKEITKVGYSHIAKCGRIQILHLTESTISDESAITIIESLKLEELILIDCSTISNSLLPTLDKSNCDIIQITGNTICPMEVKRYNSLQSPKFYLQKQSSL